MTREDLEKAAKWNDLLRRAERDMEAIEDYSVKGVVIGRSNVSDTIRIERGGSTGTGSVSCISWSDDMESDLTAALHGVFAQRVAIAKSELEALGIKDAA